MPLQPGKRIRKFANVFYCQLVAQYTPNPLQRIHDFFMLAVKEVIDGVCAAIDGVFSRRFEEFYRRLQDLFGVIAPTVFAA